MREETETSAPRLCGLGCFNSQRQGNGSSNHEEVFCQTDLQEDKAGKSLGRVSAGFGALLLE